MRERLCCPSCRKPRLRCLQTPPFEQALPGITVIRLMDLIPKVRPVHGATSMPPRIRFLKHVTMHDGLG
jgi:hypothetical protein